MTDEERIALWWAPARSYLEAAKALAEKKQHENSGPLSAPIFLLIGFHLELMLKAFHTKHGASEKDLKDLGHDLAASLLAAKAKGWTSGTKVEWLIDLMSPLHKTHTFRYLDVAEVDVPDIDESCTMLEAWDEEMQKTLFGN